MTPINRPRRSAVSEGGFGSREVEIRANGLDTEWGAADLLAVADWLWRR